MPSTSDRFDHLFIATRNFDASLRFYRDILNWQVTNQWTDDNGKRSAELTGGAVRVVIAESNELAGPAGTQAPQPHPHSLALHLDIHDADKRFAAIPPGEHIVTPPEDNHWGTRWFVLRDPDGNLIAFNEMRQKH